MLVVFTYYDGVTMGWLILPHFFILGGVLLYDVLNLVGVFDFLLVSFYLFWIVI